MDPITDPSFDGLFARAQSGEEAAWEELFRRCYPKVLRVVRRRLNQPMRSLYDSADFANDVWRSLLAKQDRFDFPNVAALRKFLEQAATQKVIDEHRRMTEPEAGPPPRAEPRRRPGRRPGPLDRRRLERPDAQPVRRGQRGLERARERLDEPHRRALEMARQGYSTREIADTLGWHLRKVQRELKQIGDEWSGPEHREVR